MRKAFIQTLTDYAAKNKRVFLLTGDLGYSFLEDFKMRFKDRFFNMGVAEQNMVGVSAGLALTGKIVFVYSIIPFVTMRCFEQIRNDVCFQNLSVRLIGVGGGLSYGPSGASHHALEDVAIMRSLVNMTVIAPGDPAEVKAAIKFAMRHRGPIYIRLGKGNEPIGHTNPVQVDKGIVLEKGRDITIIACGSMLATAKLVTETLKQKNISVRFLSMPMIKPIDSLAILESAKQTRAIFTIEEHSRLGGLGSAVSEVLAESPFKIRFKRFALPDRLCSLVGNQKYLLCKNELSVEHITRCILKQTGKKK